MHGLKAWSSVSDSSQVYTEFGGGSGRVDDRFASPMARVYKEPRT